MSCGRVPRHPGPQGKEVAIDLLSDLNKLRKEGILSTDIAHAHLTADLYALILLAKKIRAHKNGIYSSSPYFKAMLSGHFSESDQQEISIQGIDADILELLIDYMYTGSLKIDSDSVKGLIVTASFLQTTKAERLCCNFIKKNRELNADNCIEYMLLGLSISNKRLVKLSIESAGKDFLSVFSQNEFLEIEQEEFKQLVQRSKKIKRPEDLLYSFVMRWINSSYDTRINFLKDLLELIDPSLVSPHVMHDSKTLNTSSQIVGAWATRANASSTSNESGDHILVSQRFYTFRPLMIKIFSEAKHCEIMALPDGITDGSYVCNGYYIYHQGGWSRQRREPMTDSYVYHPITCEWLPFIPLQKARRYHHSCVLNEKIFSVGGTNRRGVLSSVESTDLHTGQRRFIDPLSRPKEQTGLGIHENSIYVVGGSDFGVPYKCTHRFDGSEGVWQELAPSPYRKGASSCAVIGESIYTTHVDTLQRYDIRANDWAMISAEDKIYPLEVFAIDNTLFGLFNDHVARFMPEGGKWEIQRTLNCNLGNLQVSTNLLFPNAYEEKDDDSDDDPDDGSDDDCDYDYDDDYGGVFDDDEWES